MNVATERPRLAGLNSYQWLVLGAAWLGWGFDVFDGLLFNFVAPTCVPTLLGLEIGSPEAKAATLQWAGILTSVLLVGWGTGGILFGRLADRIGRARVLLLTIGLFAVGTAACAFAPNIWVLLLCRVVASLGIGGEWAAGAAMVAEVVPEEKRPEAGALLYTSAPVGLFLASYVTYFVQGVAFPGSPETSWRYVFLFGLIPALVAFGVRLFLREPERFQAGVAPSLRELWTPSVRCLTLSGLAMSLVALITWWAVNAFLPTIAAGLASGEAQRQGLAPAAAQTLAEAWKRDATNVFNLGGLIGTLLTVPVAKRFGRRFMFGLYYAVSAVALWLTFGVDRPPVERLVGCGVLGLSIFGVFGSFTYYLPELFPTRLRATGAGFCYNVGRYLAAFGPFLVGSLAAQGQDGVRTAISLLGYLAAIPILGALAAPFVVETKGQALPE